MPKKSEQPEPLTPSAVFALRLEYARSRRRWTQQDLADRLSELGTPMDRATVARTENRARGLSLDDALLFSAAVGTSPVHMIATAPEPISGDHPIAIAPKLVVHPRQVRMWIRGQQPLEPDDAQVFYSEVSTEEWVASQNYHLQRVLSRVQDLVDAVVRDDRDEAADIIDDINEALERQQKDLQRKGYEGSGKRPRTPRKEG